MSHGISRESIAVVENACMGNFIASYVAQICVCGINNYTSLRVIYSSLR